MPRDKCSNHQLRASIAAAAARLLAEDGMLDFALAKRKAARQLGVTSLQVLPDNTEVEEALRLHQSLYQGEEQHQRTRELREEALRAMDMLAEFKPHLRGSVLKGTAGPYSGIELQLFADDSKVLEIFLLNRNIPFELTQLRHDRSIPVFLLEIDGIPLQLAVHPLNDQRVGGYVAGRTPERASAQALRLLLESRDEALE